MSNSIFDKKFDVIQLFDFLVLIFLSFWKIYEQIPQEIDQSLNFDFIHK